MVGLGPWVEGTSKCPKYKKSFNCGTFRTKSTVVTTGAPLCYSSKILEYSKAINTQKEYLLKFKSFLYILTLFWVYDKYSEIG
jgi:hypothetical protein